MADCQIPYGGMAEQIEPGTTFRWSTSGGTFIVTVLAVAAGHVLGALSAVTVDRVEGVEHERIGPLSTTPVVLPIEAVS